MKNYLQHNQADANEIYLEMGLLKAAELEGKIEDKALAECALRGALKGVKDSIVARMYEEIKSAIKITIT